VNEQNISELTNILIPKRDQRVLPHCVGPILDIGGGLNPLACADCVLDIIVYDDRKVQRNEKYNADTWIQMDICDRQPWPFPDKYFAFVNCTHVLEDVRDPVWVCSEIMRVGKAGYIECPSILREITPGIPYEGSRYAGYYHHRWLVNIEGDVVEFIMKPHLLIEKWQLHLPAGWQQSLQDDRNSVSLAWNDHFEVRERFFDSRAEIEAFLRKIVLSTGAYPKWRYKAEWFLERVRPQLRRLHHTLTQSRE
jgi:hypothetical protein